MKYKTKSIIKKVALALAGIVAVSAVGVGVAKLVEYMQDDLKTISPSFDVGNLGADGKYVNDESTLYTKEAFQCDGLQIKLDFDNEIDYQIFFYDDLDNFIESTEVLSAAYSETVHDGYARIVIIPNNDEDDKIGLTERLTYPGQMTIKVAKEQNVEYLNVFNKRLKLVNSVHEARFVYGHVSKDQTGNYIFVDSDKEAITSYDLISVDGGSTLNCNYTGDSEYSFSAYVFQFDYENGVLSVISESFVNTSKVLDDRTDFIILRVSMVDSSTEEAVSNAFSDLSIISSYFTITK